MGFTWLKWGVTWITVGQDDPPLFVTSMGGLQYALHKADEWHPAPEHITDIDELRDYVEMLARINT